MLGNVSGWGCPSLCCGPLVCGGTVTRMSTACHSKPHGCCAATPLAVTLYYVGGVHMGGVHIRVAHGLHCQVLRAVLVRVGSSCLLQMRKPKPTSPSLPKFP